MKGKRMSLSRQIKRGWATTKINPLTGFLEFWERTRNNKQHTQLIKSVDLNEK